MEKAKLEVVQKVMQQSKLSNKMVAEAFGFKDVENLNIEFLNTLGMSVAEFRQRCKDKSYGAVEKDVDVG